MIQFLARHPEQDFCVAEIAEALGEKNHETLYRILSRKASPGKGSGPVRKTRRGYYQYSLEEKIPLIDQFTRSSRFGIENWILKKELTSLNTTHVLRGYTPSQSDTDLTPQSDTNRTPKKNAQVAKSDTSDTQSDTNRTPIMKEGYPLVMPTGQEVQWFRYPGNGTEMILFLALGHPPFPLELVLHLIEALKKEGLDESWEQVSQEWDFDSRKYSVLDPVKFQVAEQQLLKFYQHGNMARLEGVDHRCISISDALLCLNEVYERGQGRTALKKVVKAEKDIRDLMNDNRRMNNYLMSLSNRVTEMRDRKKGKRKERPLV